MKKAFITLIFIISITNTFSQGVGEDSDVPGFSDDVIDNNTSPIDSNIIALIGVAVLYGLYKIRNYQQKSLLITSKNESGMEDMFK
jgi:hypothetical protein